MHKLLWAIVSLFSVVILIAMWVVTVVIPPG
jgi:hypothetical protein